MALPVVRSHYSLMQGTASPKHLARRARELGHACLALADRDNLYGLWEFRRACREQGLRPITGAEVTSPDGAGRAWCLAESAAGFVSLCRLLTRRHTEEGFDLGRAVAEESQGLAVLTDDARLLEAWHGQGVPALAALPRKPTGSCLVLRRTARRLGAPLVALADACLLEPGDRARHRLLRAIALNTSLERLGPADTPPPEALLAGPPEYARRFASLPRRSTGPPPWPSAWPSCPRRASPCPPGTTPKGVAPMRRCGIGPTPGRRGATARPCPARRRPAWSASWG